jgi:hypothetical protein
VKNETLNDWIADEKLLDEARVRDKMEEITVRIMVRVIWFEHAMSWWHYQCLSQISSRPVMSASGRSIT